MLGAICGSAASGVGSTMGSGAGVDMSWGCSATVSCGFLRSHPNRPFFSPAGAGVFLSSLEPNMEDGYLKVATRQSGASEKFCMRNRLLLCPLVHLLAVGVQG